MDKMVSLKNKEKINFSQYGIYLVLVFLVVLSGILNENFFSKANITNVLRQISVITIVALGQTLLIISGQIDLSCGAVLAISGILSVMLYKVMGNLWIALLAGIGIGVVCGFFIGFVVTFFRVPAFIVTLAVTNITRGGLYLITGGSNVYGLEDYVVLGQGAVAGIPIPILLMIAMCIIVWVLLNKTCFGRYLFAIGGNKSAAVAAGISTSKTLIKAYVLNGALVGLAGCTLVARLNAGLVSVGTGYEFDAITAAIIGGTSFSGGVGTIGGTIVGSLIVGVLQNILNLMSVQSFVQEIIKGIIILAAVIYDLNSNRWRYKKNKSL